MKIRWYKQLSLVIVIAMFVSILPVYVAAADVVAEEAIVHFVNHETPSKLSGMASYMKNGKIYTQDDQAYLRIDVKQVYDVKFVLEGKEGTKVGEYETTEVGRDGKETAVTYFTFDYAVSDVVAVLEGSVSYFVPGVFKETQVHDVYVVINNDVEAVKAELTALIAEADDIASPSEALETALAAAVAANSYITKKVDMEAALAGLKAAMSPTIADAIVHFVNHETPSKLSGMASYMKNGKIYTQDDQAYLRIDVKQVYDVKFVLEGKEGTKVGEYETTEVGRDGKETAVTYFTFDYALSDATAILEGSVSYFVPGVFKETQVHDVYVVINNDVEAVKAELTALIAEANEIASKSQALETALAAAVAANSYITKKAAMETALENLKAAMSPTIADAIVHFVNHETPSNLSGMASYMKNGKTYTEDGTAYLRIDVKQVYDVKFVLEGKEGTKVGEYETTEVGRDGKETAVTYFTFDYALSDVTAILEGSVSYFVPGVFKETQVHDVYVVINNDVEAVKAELVTLIDKIKKITSRPQALETALAAAVAANSYITKKVVMEASLAALQTALKNYENGTNTPGGNGGSTSPIHEASGLEVGKYEIPVTVLKHNSDETSTMNQYVAADARLNVTTGKLTVYLAMNNASMIKNLTINGQTASVAERYTVSDVVRYRFDVSSLTGKISGSVHVIATDNGQQIYDMTHPIELTFGSPTKVEKWEDEGWIKGETTNVPEEGKEETEVKPTEPEAGSGSEDNGSSTSTPKFTDIAGSWAQAAIERAVSLKLVNGYTDGSFKPNSSINRAEFTAIIARALKLEAASGQLQFADAGTVQDWAKPYIQQAVEAGIITGFADKTFRPSANITRIEMAVMLVKGLGLDQEQAEAASFKDAADIPAWAQRYVAIAVKHGLIKGNTDGTFKPNQAATRAEAITIALRAVDYKNN